MTDYREQIDKALLAHGAWKQQLNAAIGTSASQFTVAQLRADNLCEFGKWFHSLPPDVQSAQIPASIKKLHAEFHLEASKILDLALKGRKDQALEALGQGQAYNKLSGQLMLAMRQWENTLAD